MFFFVFPTENRTHSQNNSMFGANLTRSFVRSFKKRRRRILGKPFRFRYLRGILRGVLLRFPCLQTPLVPPSAGRTEALFRQVLQKAAPPNSRRTIRIACAEYFAASCRVFPACKRRSCRLRRDEPKRALSSGPSKSGAAEFSANPSDSDNLRGILRGVLLRFPCLQTPLVPPSAGRTEARSFVRSFKKRRRRILGGAAFWWTCAESNRGLTGFVCGHYTLSL